MSIKKSVLSFFKRGGDAKAYDEVLTELEATKRLLDVRAQEHEEHLTEIRKERDHYMFQVDQYKEVAEYVSEKFENDIPSFTEQTKWRAGLIDIATKPGVWFFNPSLTKIGDDMVLFMRRNMNIRQTNESNDLCAGVLTPELTVPSWNRLQIPNQFIREHWEDPRVVKTRGGFLVSCTNFIPGKTYAHQIIVALDNQYRFQKTWHPIYGKNSGDIGTNAGHEKNWLWFGDGEKLYMIYSTFPHVVVRFSDDFHTVIEEYESRAINPLWWYGEPRGGTPPVRVGDEYWTFFHSSTPWIKQKRRYHMGVIAFSAEPPFRITRMSSMPLLSGSKNDPWVEGLPLVIFPGGALHDKKTNSWSVVFGVNDCACGYIEIPHQDLVETTRLVSEVSEEDVVLEKPFLPHV